MTLQEAHERFRHLDDLLSGLSTSNPIHLAARELWAAVKDGIAVQDELVVALQEADALLRSIGRHRDEWTRKTCDALDAALERAKGGSK